MFKQFVKLRFISGSRTRLQKETIIKANELCERLSKAHNYATYVTGIFYVLKPIILSYSSYVILDIPRSYELLFKSDYIFETSSSPGYEIAFGIQVSITLFATTYVVSTFFLLFQLFALILEYQGIYSLSLCFD